MISRRDFLELAGAGAAWAAMPGRLRAGPSARRKNVLFIAVDDLRPELGCYGNRRALSPNIDRLAARGTVFERAYCQQAVCSPSRTSLLTGCRPDTTRVYDLETHFRKTIPDVVTLPQHFKNNGYHVQGFSKIYHGSLNDERSWSVPWWRPASRQYQLNENMDSRARETGAGRKQPDRNATRGAPVECADVPDSAYADGATADKAVQALRAVKGQAFFLAVGFLKPHLPFVAPKKYWDLYRRDEIQLASNPFAPKNFPQIAGTTWGELRKYAGVPKAGPVPEEDARKLIHGYLACVSYTDAQIGKVLAELDRLGLREETIVVLWGDHGWKLGEHGMWCKHTNFELDTRSTLVMAGPGQRAAGCRARGLTEFVDIYPTLCEVCGLAKPGHLEGASFAPLLDHSEQPWRRAAFSQYPRGAAAMGYSLRTDRWRYTEWQSRGDGTVTDRELYDHDRDPDENENVAAVSAHAAEVRELAGLLRSGWRAAGPPGKSGA